ncbi:MAG: ribosomal protein S18 acetylase RimI-like enzyme [Parvibaculaceae bacterium]|jgi:ribosomal protein S18 acetylase RimI-like enzyme|nr:GNAT family N-acetyltransferase [Parvibaculaceae bacterium]
MTDQNHQNTPPLSFRSITLNDREVMEELVRSYYAFDGLTFKPDLHGPALDQLVHNPEGVFARIIEKDSVVVGYFVITFGFSLYYGGKDGFIDELFLKEEARGGNGTFLLNTIIEHTRKLGLASAHLEVTDENLRAQALYKKLGFAPTGHNLMSLILD